MKKSDVFKTILAEASGRSLKETDDLYRSFTKANPQAGMDAEISDTEAAELIGQLRQQLPAISAWMIQGGFRVHSRTVNPS